MAAAPTLREAIRSATRVLQAAGIDSAQHDAKLLAAYALNYAANLDSPAADAADGAEQIKGEAELDSPAAHRAHPLSPASPTDVFNAGDAPAPAIYHQWVQQRARRTPLQHIVGSAPFCGHDFFSSPAGFIPRPETELIVEWAVEKTLRILRNRLSAQLGSSLFSGRLRVLDLCSGPGTIALGYAARLGEQLDSLDQGIQVGVVGVELHEAAVELARRNETSLRLRGALPENISAEFLVGDVRDPRLLMRHALVAEFDLVLANPPYVPAGTEVSPEVSADAPDAVFSGEDGLELMPSVVATAARAASPLCYLAIEHDDSTGLAVAEMLNNAAGEGVSAVQQHQDYAGRDRFVTATIRRDPGYIPPRHGAHPKRP